MPLSYHIAIELGASNGRVFLGCFSHPDLEIIEVHRFLNGPIYQDDHWRWNWPGLLAEIQDGLHKAAEMAGDNQIVSLACDSWAQDFALLDAEGKLLENPICYRDKLTQGLPQAFAHLIAPRDLVKRVGCCVSPITTLCKLKALQDQRPELLRKAKVILHIADLVHFSLCGKEVTDWSMATAGQLFNIQHETWDLDLLSRLHIPTHLLPPLIMHPRVIGRVKRTASPHPKLNDVPVISTLHHDTPCATAALRPLKKGSYLISIGTYAMPGCILDTAEWPADADPETNALIGVADHHWGMFGSCAGMWIIQECQRIWQGRGIKFNYDQLVHMAETSHYWGTIDLNTSQFSKPADMIVELNTACREAKLPEPEEPADIVKLVFDSLAEGFYKAIVNLQKATGMPCHKLCLIGGGSRNSYLVQRTVERIGCEFIVGPAEATAVGNLTIQREVVE